MSAARLILSAMFVLASGCMLSTVTQRAQNDLGCGDVSVTETGGGEWQASGCGMSASYTCMYAQTGPIGGSRSPVCIREGDLDSVRILPVPVAVPIAKEASPSAFPLVAAMSTMKLAASFAQDCNALPGPRGDGTADVVFSSDGHVSSVVLSDPFQGTAVGECVADKFRRVTLPAFSSDPKPTRKRFEVI